MIERKVVLTAATTRGRLGRVLGSDGASVVACTSSLGSLLDAARLMFFYIIII